MKKFLDRAFLAALLVILAAVPAGTWLWGRLETTAYYENRTLAQLPQLTWQALWDGSYGTALESWYSDHVPGRTTLLKTDTAVQMRLLDRPVVNGVVLKAGDVLVPYLDFDTHTEEEYAAAAVPIADDFSAFSGYVESYGGLFCYVGFPEQRVYFEDAFPDYFNSHAEEAEIADAVFAGALAERGVDFLDMRAVYAAQGDPAEYYSAVDHHYNYYGAYAAYRAILEHLAQRGMELPVLTEEDLTFRELPNPYLGTRNRKLYNLWPNTDRAIIAQQKEPVAFTRTDNGVPSDKPLFVLPASDDLPTTYLSLIHISEPTRRS